MIELEDAELHDADDRADRPGGDDDVDAVERAPSGQQAIGDRYDREEQQLLAVDEADRADRSRRAPTTSVAPA